MQHARQSGGVRRRAEMPMGESEAIAVLPADPRANRMASHSRSRVELPRPRQARLRHPGSVKTGRRPGARGAVTTDRAGAAGATAADSCRRYDRRVRKVGRRLTCCIPLRLSPRHLALEDGVPGSCGRVQLGRQSPHPRHCPRGQSAAHRPLMLGDNPRSRSNIATPWPDRGPA